MRINGLEDQLKRANVKELLLKTKNLGTSKESIASDDESSDSDKDVVFVNDTQPSKQHTRGSKLDSNKNIVDTDYQVLSVDEIRLISLMSSYLIVHPFGACLDHIKHYVQEACNESGSGAEIDNILRRHSNIFTRANLDSSQEEAKWKFCGFLRK